MYTVYMLTSMQAVYYNCRYKKSGLSACFWIAVDHYFPSQW